MLMNCADRSSHPGKTRPRVLPRKDATAVIHLTAREGLSAVYMAQVARPMSLLRAAGVNVHLVAIPPIGELVRPRLRMRWQERRAEVAGNFGLGISLLPAPPTRLSRLWDPAIALRAKLQRHCRSVENIVLHCRGTESTLAALRACRGLLRIKVLSDVRGINAPEAMMYQGHVEPDDAPVSIRQLYAERDERQRQAVTSAGAVICVSRAMREELGLRWNIRTESFGVVPCCTDVEAGARAASRREITRGELGLADKLVIAYCGGCQPWQMLDQSLALFRCISEVRPNAHLLALTTDGAGIPSALTSNGIAADQYSILSVPHFKVAEILAAADVGLLLRDASVVNRVASPVKFAEYLSCGLPVIISNGVGDYSGEVKRQALGMVVPAGCRPHAAAEFVIPWLDRLAEEAPSFRLRCSRFAAENLNWERYLPDLLEQYRALLYRLPAEAA
jgi:glycosyltransferase involved in cell wall biosynthesis